MPYNKPIPRTGRKCYYVIVFQRMHYWHRGIWSTRAAALRNADDLDPSKVQIKRCWVATEKN